MLPGILPCTFPHPEAARAVEEDLAKGILEVIDRYRAEKKAALKVSLPEEVVEIGSCLRRGGSKPKDMTASVTETARTR